MKRNFLKNNFKGIIMISAALLIIAVLAGSLSAVFLNEEHNENIYRYLSAFFADYSENINKSAVCRRSFEMNIRLFIPLVISGFFAAGTIVSFLCIIMKGFVWGFCGGIYIKYYGINGILLSAASFPSYILVIVPIILFTGLSMEFRGEKDKKRGIVYYMIISFFMLILFSCSALLDGYAACSAISAVIPRL